MPVVAPAHWRGLDPQRVVRARDHEIKVGQAIRCLTASEVAEGLDDALQVHYQAGARVAILGVPEDIGPRANLGRGGSQGGWQAFISSFMNLQANSSVPISELLVAGWIDCDDLQLEANELDANEPQQLNRLRELCHDIDQRVMQVVAPLFANGYEVILIGGGHNNAYPLLMSLYETTGQRCGAVNLDPHADFRPREGRHSGNGFSYAHMDGALAYYHVVALHEGKNSATSMRSFSDAGFRYHSIHRLYDMPFMEGMHDVTAKAASWQVPLGIEVDVDAINQVPASALNYTGVTIPQAFRYVSQLAELSETRYLHLAEAAPARHPAGTEAGEAFTGQLLSELVLAYLYARERRV